MSATDDRRSPKGGHDHPSRPDLTNSIAVVVSAPGYLYPKGGHRESDGTWRDDPDWTRERFAPIVASFIEHVRETLPPELHADAERITADNYIFGPVGRGGMYEAVHYVFQIVPDATKIAGNLQTWITIGGWTLGLKAKWRDFLEHARRQGNAIREYDQLVFAPNLAQSVCVAHAASHYGPIEGSMRVKSYSRQSGYGSADLPNGAETYHVSLTTKRGTVCYLIDGRLTPLDFVVLPNGIEPLDLPAFASPSFDPKTLDPRFGEITTFPEFVLSGKKER